MNLNKEIGGYFELELNDFGSIYHNDLVALNSGRNALKYILKQSNYKRIYIPYYTCDVILQPLEELGIEYEFYHINHKFEPIDVDPINGEAILYVNYFGVMQQQVNDIVNKYKNVIIDNSQAFFDKPIPKVDSFFSPRKFFGLPDGGFAYCPENIDLQLERDNKSDSTFSHLLIRANRGAEAGYDEFRKNDELVGSRSLKKISLLTEKLMRNIDFPKHQRIRMENFNYLHSKLKDKNELSHLLNPSRIKAPMVYPFLRKGNSDLRRLLISNKVFTAIYWPNVKVWLNEKITNETYFQDNIIALPIDHRYNIRDLNTILKYI
jgi:hypothetical protein